MNVVGWKFYSVLSEAQRRKTIRVWTEDQIQEVKGKDFHSFLLKSSRKLFALIKNWNGKPLISVLISAFYPDSFLLSLLRCMFCVCKCACLQCCRLLVSLKGFFPPCFSLFFLPHTDTEIIQLSKYWMFYKWFHLLRHIMQKLHTSK